MQLEPGAPVAGKYRLDRRIGIGGMGEVWAAVQLLTRKSVALKFLREPQASDPDTRRRFLREARAACAVRHPNVVQVHDVIELDDGSPVMVMELLHGESLEERLKREGRLTVGDLTAVVARVVSAVGTAHALGIVHRDLKPDNIFLSQTPEGVDVKVLDFGIAKLTALDGDAALTGGLTSTGTMLGTPFYMSPEQAFGEKKIDHRADIWSLGIILYRGVSGILPTRADNIGQILKIIMTQAIPPLASVAPHAPRDLVELVDRMLEQSPAKRPADLREVNAVLVRYAGVVVEDFSAPASGIEISVPSIGGVGVGVDTAAGTAQSQSRATQMPGKGRGITIALVAFAVLAVATVAGLSLRRQAAATTPLPLGAVAPTSAALDSPSSSSNTRSASRSGRAPDVGSTLTPAPSVASSAPIDASEPSLASAAVSALSERAASGPKPAPAQQGGARAQRSAAPSAAPAAPAKTSVGGVVTNPPF